MVSLSPSSRAISLSNGVQLPLLGLGTTHSGGYNHDAVVYALQHCHYRLIDTAKRYGVEQELGRAIVESRVPREDIFLTSKLWPVDFGLHRTKEAFTESCSRLQTTYLDSYLLHSPVVPCWFEESPNIVREETWRALELLYDSDQVRSIGVSNYTIEHLEQLLDSCSVNPHVNQMEFHPYQNPDKLRRFCVDNDISFMGYCPLAKGTILREWPILEVAQRTSHTPAQICIRWSIQQNVPAIPKSTKPFRLCQNAAVFDFSLSNEDMNLLNSLHDNRRLVSLDNWQIKFELPEGYKLGRGTTDSETILPPLDCSHGHNSFDAPCVIGLPISCPQKPDTSKLQNRCQSVTNFEHLLKTTSMKKILS